MVGAISSRAALGNRHAANLIICCLFWLLADHLCSAEERKKSRLKNALIMYSNTPPPEGMFKNCALVGSAKDMLGQKRGKEIDSHDTVIRINRLPNRQFEEDFGTKLDVYFIRGSHAMTHEYNGILMGRGEQHRCSYRKRKPGQDICDPKFLIMGGYADAHMYKAYLQDENSFKLEDHFMPIAKGKPLNIPAQGALPIAYQKKEVLFATHLFRNLTMTEPSTGFHAILTFGALCESLHLYGFSGTGTADNHDMWRGHPIEREHVIIDNIIKGAVTERDFAAGQALKTKAATWLRRALQDFAQRGHISFPPVGAGDRSLPGGVPDAAGGKNNSETCVNGAGAAACRDPEEESAHSARQEEVVDSSELPNAFYLVSIAKSMAKFGSCGLVAPSATLLKGNRGRQIDSHDTVIRINRLPTADVYKDFGRKTDAYFLRHSHARERRYVAISAGNGGVQVQCKYSLDNSEDACNGVSTLVLGGGVSGGDLVSYLKDPSSFKWDKKLSPVMKGKPQFPETRVLPVAYQREDIAIATHMFEKLIGKEPSVSFHAYLTFSPLCQSMTLYGFEDTQAPDDSKKKDKWEGRPSVEENLIIERLRKGTIGDDDLRAGKARRTGAFKWLQESLDSFKVDGPKKRAPTTITTTTTTTTSATTSTARQKRAAKQTQSTSTTTTTTTTTSTARQKKTNKQSKSTSATTTTTTTSTARPKGATKPAKPTTTTTSTTTTTATTANATTAKKAKEKTASTSQVKAYDSDSLMKLVQPRYMTMLSSGKLESGLFKRCALVSSTAHQTHKGLGKEIDSHSTVIRTNRIPSSEFFDDLGKKTDIYFVRHAHLQMVGFNGILVGRGAQHLCQFKVRAGDECNLAVLILGGDVSPADLRNYKKDPESFSWEKKRSMHVQGKEITMPRKGALPVATQAKEIAMAAVGFKQLKGAQPGLGLHAILTLAPICDIVDVYGFDGADNEKAVLDALATRRISDQDLSNDVKGTKAHRWLQEHFAVFGEKGRINVITPKIAATI